MRKGARFPLVKWDPVPVIRDTQIHRGIDVDPMSIRVVVLSGLGLPVSNIIHDLEECVSTGAEFFVLDSSSKTEMF